MTGHPLDRPVWEALTCRQAALAIGDARAVRFRPDHALFAAAADGGAAATAALAGLVGPGETIATFQAEGHAVPSGLALVAARSCHQLVADRVVTPAPSPLPIVSLGDADAAEMLALATLTAPGPFFARTHRLGAFVGIRVDGRLAAMAGERLKPGAFTEVSGVCTHPDHRGRGFARVLLRRKAADIAARGETAFLHSYSDNAGAIALYESLGFAFRRTIMLTLMRRPAESDR